MTPARHARAADVALGEAARANCDASVGSASVARIRVAVVYGGRSSEHGISVRLRGQRARRARPRRKYDVIPIGITPAGRVGAHRRRPERAADHRPHAARGREGHRGRAAAGPDRGRAGHASSRAPACRCSSRSTWCSRCCTAGSARTAPSRACSRWPACPTSGPACSPAPPPWTRSSPRSCCAPRAARSGELRGAARAASGVARSTSQHLGLPVFVKPARAGSSVGITKVSDWADLPRRASTMAFEHDSKVLVEAAVRRPRDRVRRARGRRTAGRGERARRDPAGARATTGTTSRPSTSTTPASSTSRRTCPPERDRRDAGRRVPGVHRARLRRAWRASTSSSRPTAASWSTR